MPESHSSNPHNQSFLVSHWLVTGNVQGVGFRRFVDREARLRNLGGGVRNLKDGRVEILAIGPRESLQSLMGAVQVGPRLSRVDGVSIDQRPFHANMFVGGTLNTITDSEFKVLADGEAPWSIVG